MSKKFQRYRALIFDYDDTLVNTFKVRSRALRECARVHYKKEVSMTLIKTFWGTPFEDFLPIIMDTKHPFEQIASKYYKIVKKYPLKLLPGVKETLALLAAEYLLGIVTSSNKALVSYDFEDVGLEKEMFFVIQTSTETKYHKPDHRVFLPIIDRLKRAYIHPKEVLVIGDSFYDQQAAEKAGFDFLGVATGLVSYDEFYRGFVNVIHNMSELPGYLDSLAKD